MKRLTLLFLILVIVFCSSCGGVSSFSNSGDGRPYFCGDTEEITIPAGEGFAWLFYQAGGYTQEYQTGFYERWIDKVRSLNGIGGYDLGAGKTYTVTRICH